MKHSISSLISAAEKYLPDLNSKRLQRAYDFADQAHNGQLRKDGTPYITHPLAAAHILTKLHVDEDTLIACLLHDVPEDTVYDLKDLEKLFGKKVRFLVEGITKLSKVHYHDNMQERQVESLKKLFIHSAQDLRTILIKLADRLHNMQTINAIPKPEKRVRISKETLEIYVPVANLLGIWELKSQLEDLSFKTLFPEEFKMIDENVKKTNIKHDKLLKRSIEAVKKLLRSYDIKDFKIEGREKSHYSIYRKMLRQGKSFNEIFDLMGIRIVVADVGACYQVLGILHQNFTPKLGRLKDYIAIPKNNGYQSIHTTVFGIDGNLTEFQIRTEEMDLESSYGVAAHYFYANGKNKKTLKQKWQRKSQWVQRILDIQRDIKNNEDFIEGLKLDVFQDRIFVFTPKGDVIDLPRGSTVLDFAYHIHSDIGNFAVSAHVNGKPESLRYILKSGDVANIETSKESGGPKISWIDQVNTALARNKIREYLKYQSKDKLIAQGEKQLDEKLKVFGHPGIDAITKGQRGLIQRYFEQNSWKSVMTEIGAGILDPRELIQVVYSEEEIMGEEAEPRRASYSGEKVPEKVHKVHFYIEVINKIGMLRDLTSALADLEINILNMSSLLTKDRGVNILDFYVEIQDLKQLEKAMFTMGQIPGVIKVTRIQNGQ